MLLLVLLDVLEVVEPRRIVAAPEKMPLTSIVQGSIFWMLKEIERDRAKDDQGSVEAVPETNDQTLELHTQVKP